MKALKYGQAEMWIVPCFWLHTAGRRCGLQLGSYWLLPAIREIVLVSPLIIFGSGSGSWEGSIILTPFGDSSSVYRIVQCGQEDLLFVLTETYKFKGIIS